MTGSINRRRFIAAGAVAAAAATAPGASSAAEPRLRRIATEESFNIPEIAAATRRFMMAGGVAKEPGFAALVAGFHPARGGKWIADALDFGERRVAAMTAANRHAAANARRVGRTDVRDGRSARSCRTGQRSRRSVAEVGPAPLCRAGDDHAAGSGSGGARA